MTELNFIIKCPSQKEGDRRKNFSILRVEKRTDKSRKATKLAHPTLDEINRRYCDGKETFEEALKQVKRLRESLNSERFGEKPSESIPSENMKVFDAYWEAEYAHRNLIDLDSAETDLLRAVKAVGLLSLKTSDVRQLQKQVNSLPPNKQRRVVARVNQLLNFLGRGFRLKKGKKPKVAVRHLNESEFKRVIRFAENETLRDLMTIAFYSGLRIGEIFALEKRQIRETNTLLIDQQMDSDLRIRSPKREKTRHAFVANDGLDSLKRWLLVPMETRKTSRNSKWGERVTRACSKAFPAESEKFLNFHDLRHSYAIHLISSGIHINEVALCLGDGIQTCQDHYIGFIRDIVQTQGIADRLAAKTTDKKDK